jgi:hypothetical protein
MNAQTILPNETTFYWPELQLSLLITRGVLTPVATVVISDGDCHAQKKSKI